MPLVSRIVRDADPEQPISNVRTLEEIVQANTAPRFVHVRIIAAFASRRAQRSGCAAARHPANRFCSRAPCLQQPASESRATLPLSDDGRVADHSATTHLFSVLYREFA
jgi:hypothetical protein